MNKTELFERMEELREDGVSYPYGRISVIDEAMIQGVYWKALRVKDEIVACYSGTTGRVYVREEYDMTTENEIGAFVSEMKPGKIIWLTEREDHILLFDEMRRPIKAKDETFEKMLDHDWEEVIENIAVN